jgi:hypothetical protein
MICSPSVRRTVTPDEGDERIGIIDIGYLHPVAV